MIPEPFTLMATGFSIAMILINAAASTLEACSARMNKYREYGNQLKRVASSIHECEFEFADCLSDWRDDGEDSLLRKEDCIEIFGESRFLFLQDLISEIITALAHVQQVLFHGYKRVDVGFRGDEESESLAGGSAQQFHAGRAYRDALDWMDHADQKEIFGSVRQNKRQSKFGGLSGSRFEILVRIKYTLWEGQVLKQRADELHESVQKLRRFTTTLSKHVPNLDPSISNPAFADKVKFMLSLNREWSKFSSIMETISGNPFSLMPRQPDKDGHVNCLREGSDITASMLVEERDEQGGPTKRNIVYVTYSIAKVFPRKLLREKALLGRCGETSAVRITRPSSKGKSIRDLYQDASTKPENVQAKLQRVWEKERAETALALITWTLLLWRTSWSRCICTARLWRYPSSQDRVRISMLPCASECLKGVCNLATTTQVPASGEHAASQSYFGRTPAAAEIERARRTLMSLAVTLCELALISPVTVASGQDRALRFSCDGETLGEEQILLLVERMMTRTYRRAVEKCLAFAKAPRCKMTAASEIVQFSDAVLVPLEKWKAEVVDVRDRIGDERHWRAYLKLLQGVHEPN